MKNKFLQGAMILTIAGMAVKVLGSVNRILLSRLLGGEGIGIYQIAYPIYLFLISISGAGVPVAISILVAKRVAEKDLLGAQRVFKTSLLLMTITGFLFALSLYGASNWLITSGIIRDGRAYYSLMALIPAVFFSTILASVRGFFQGHQLMTPPAISQILEQLVRVVVMLSLATYLLPQGLAYGAAGAAFGAVPGALMGIIVLSCFYYKHQELRPQRGCPREADRKESVWLLGKRLLVLALSVSCANLMLPLVTGIDMLMVPWRLELAGFRVEEATRAFGYLAGMALPLVSMATIPTMSIATSVVPALSEARALGEKEKGEERTLLALRLCLIFVLPATVGVMLLGTDLAKLLYGTLQAGPVISNLAPSILFLGLHQVTTGILQGQGYTVVPMATMGLSALVKIGLLWLWVAQPSYNILGAAWASNVNFAVAALLNLGFLLRHGQMKLPYGSWLRITMSAAFMGAVVALSQVLLGEIRLGVLLIVPLGIVSYGVALLALGEAKPAELKSLVLRRRKK